MCVLNIANGQLLFVAHHYLYMGPMKRGREGCTRDHRRGRGQRRCRCRCRRKVNHDNDLVSLCIDRLSGASELLSLCIQRDTRDAMRCILAVFETRVGKNVPRGGGVEDGISQAVECSLRGSRTTMCLQRLVMCMPDPGTRIPILG